MAQTSGTYLFSPSVSEMLIDAYERIQIFSPSITSNHIISARRSLNLLLSHWSGNLGVNLWAVDQITVPLTPGQPTFQLPPETVQILDAYLRTYQPNSANAVNVGNALTPVGPPGNPLVAQPAGDPLIIQPGSGTLSATAGSATIGFQWPSHGLSVGSPIFWGCPVTVGGITIQNFSIVSAIIDVNNLQFMASVPAVTSQTLQGSTALFSSNAGSGQIDVVLPGHGLSVGSSFPIPIAITIGGITLPAGSTQTVTIVESTYQFSFTPGGVAGSTQSIFQNGGQLNVSSQSAMNSQPQDILMFPLSRTDYASIPQKYVTGRPTSFWFDRISQPNFSIYPVVPQGFFYGFVAYRLRKIQDANPTMGQIPDVSSRFWEPLTAGLCAQVAEKFRPEAFAAKLALAQTKWDIAASADMEHVQTSVKPNVMGYYRG